MSPVINSSPLACRALVALLYSPPADTTWEGFDATIRLSSMSSLLGTRPQRLKEAFQTLKAHGLIDKLETGYGYVKVRIASPAPLSRLLN